MRALGRSENNEKPMRGGMLSTTVFRMLASAALVLGLCAWPVIAEAIIVDCNKPNVKLGPKANGTAKVIDIVLKGTCTENVVITRDDVTIRTDGVTPAAIQALDPGLAALQLDGAHRIRIDGVSAGGITISGGSTGITATRGSTLTLSHCTVSGASVNGVVSANGSTVSVDHCTIGPNTGNGVVAAHAASLTITDSVVSGNTGSGIVATRSSYARVGQDAAGTLTVKPVTVSGNGVNGIAITESSAGNVVGGVIETSGSTNLFVGRASSGQIGLGSNNLMGGVTIQNGSRAGVSVEGGNATIAFSAITGNDLDGITIFNGGSARIGILNNNSAYAPTTVSGNAREGIHVSIGGAATIGGTTASSNGRFGVGVFAGSANLVGDNVISNNTETGLFVSRNGQVLVGNADFGLTTTNTMSGNGVTGPNTGGIFAFQGGAIQVQDATISNNTGAAVQCFEGGIVELRGATAVTVPGGGTTHGLTAQFGCVVRLRDTASVVSATGDGIQASNLTAINVRDGNTVQGHGPGAVGVRCFNAAPLTASAATLTGGNLANVTGTTGSSVGCNTFP